METNILHAISSRYNFLTKSGKKLADYVLTNKFRVQYMSISSLAEHSQVSEATITRFCKELGISGYNSLKLELAKANVALNHEFDSSMEIGTIAESDSFTTICKKLFSRNVAALRETLELIDEVNCEKAVQFLSNANHVYCFGQGSSNVMAKEAWARFSTITPNFIHIEDSHMQTMAASLCTPSDVILFFSYSGSTKDVSDILTPAKHAGARVILITHFSNSPAAAFADSILLCGSKENPLQSGSIAAKLGQLFIIDYLFHQYCKYKKSICVDNLDKTSSAISSKLL